MHIEKNFLLFYSQEISGLIFYDYIVKCIYVLNEMIVKVLSSS